MQLAMYKGPADDGLRQAAHLLVCALTLSRYSHVELVIDGTAWTSSVRDGGVRGKAIDLQSGHWDLFPVAGDQARALAWFEAHKGQRYDWIGVLRVSPLLSWLLPRRPAEWFCSEAVAAALGLAKPSQYTPQSLLDKVRAC